MNRPNLVALSVMTVSIALAAGVRWATKAAPSAKAASVTQSTEDEPPAVATTAIAVPRREPPTQDPLRLIDDMAGVGNAIDGPGLMGYWYTLSDGTGTTYPRTGDRAYRPSRYRGRPAREVRGGGQTDWGAGFGLDLTAAREEGLGGKAISAPFNASAYSGIRFDGASATGRLAVQVQLSDVDTNPLGGVCNPNSTWKDQCGGDYGTAIQLTEDWQTLTVSFAALELPTWSQIVPAREHGFVKSKLYSIRFQVQPADHSLPLPDFDLYVANLYFVR